jgi:hypothetical protein
MYRIDIYGCSKEKKKHSRAKVFENDVQRDSLTSQTRLHATMRLPYSLPFDRFCHVR